MSTINILPLLLLCLILKTTEVINSVGINTALGYKIPLMLSRDRMDSMTANQLHAIDEMYASYIDRKFRQAAAEDTTTSSTTMPPGTSLGTVNYLINITLGTPSTSMMWVVHIACDLTWTQCLPCVSCYPQRDPVFDPAASSTYKPLECSSTTECADALGPYKAECESGATCQYQQAYTEGSATFGDFASDSLRLGRSGAVIPGYQFGCGHNNTGTSFLGFSGILCLSRNVLSFLTQAQLDSFAYCLPDPSSTAAGYLEFNGTAGAGAACAPLLFVEESSLYVVNTTSVALNGVTVAGAPPFHIVIDPGALTSLLPPESYDALRNAFVNVTTSYLTPSSPVSPFDTCYSYTSVEAEKSKLPILSFSFSGATSEYTLSANGVLYRVPGTNSSCFAFRPTSSDRPTPILGNVQQQGRRLTMDITGSQACFEVTGSSCS